MKRLLSLVSALACLAACQSNSTTASSAKSKPADVAPAKAPLANQEYADWSTLTVNGKPRQELTTKLLESQLGRPDSIAKGVIECGGVLENLNKGDNTVGDVWYYGGAEYEVSGGQAIIDKFDVASGKFYGKLGPLDLNQHTTLADVRRRYPLSAKDADVPAPGGRPGQVMSLILYDKGRPTDASLELVFKQGRLQEVVFFFPC